MKLNEANPAMAVIHAEVRAADRHFLVRPTGRPHIGSVQFDRPVAAGRLMPQLDVIICAPTPCGGLSIIRLHVFGQN